MTENPKVSVLMPAYNAEKYVAEAIESVLGQTFKDFELIIVDDASTDRTPEIIEAYAKKDDRIRVFRNPKNVYISVTRNLAIEKSKADLLAVMDADDISMPDRLEKQFAFLANHPEVAIVGAWLGIMDENKKDLGVRKYLPDDDSLRKKIFRYSPVAQPVVMYRKKVVQEFGCYRPVIAPSEDLVLWLKIGTKYKFANLQEVLLKYRFFKNSSSNAKLRFVEKKTLKIRWQAWRHQGYKPGFFDVFYNIAQAMTIYLLPAKWRIRLFDVVRKYL